MAEYYLSEALARLWSTVEVWWGMWQTEAFVFVLIAWWAISKAVYHDREQF